jgi:hypothetical protein
MSASNEVNLPELFEPDIDRLNSTTGSHAIPALLTFLSKAIRSGLEIAGNTPQTVLVARQ